MEIVYLWLDDLEDLIFSFVLTWERLRLRYLQAGFVTALILLAFQSSDARTPWAPSFAWAALGSVAIWLAGLLAVRFLSLHHDPVPASSQPNA
ncbi:MAG: hypothetical protein V3S67_03525 [Gammaproteobacteria bacterium]